MHPKSRCFKFVRQYCIRFYFAKINSLRVYEVYSNLTLLGLYAKHANLNAFTVYSLFI